MKTRIRNKEKQKAWAIKHYLKNREKMIEKAKIQNKLARERNKNYVKNYLSEHPCVDCGNDNIIVLEFDHITDDKEHNISDMIISSYSIETIENEISKCEVRCANCHRITTHNRRKGKELDAANQLS